MPKVTYSATPDPVTSRCCQCSGPAQDLPWGSALGKVVFLLYGLGGWILLTCQSLPLSFVV